MSTPFPPAAAGRAMPVEIDPAAVTRVLAIAIGALTALHVAQLLVCSALGHCRLLGLSQLFDTNLEQNVPAFFSALNMLFCALLLVMLARADSRRNAAGWSLLALLFLLLPFDELFAVHETLNVPLRERLGSSGPLFFAWVIPYALAVAIVAPLLLRLLRGVPKATRRGFVDAGALFLAGAVGLEMIAASLAGAPGERATLPVLVAQTLEELLEMSGVALFTRALLRYMAERGIAFSLRAPAGS